MSAITSTPPAPVPASRPDRPCRLVEWKPWPFDSSLRGHATVDFSGWLVLRIPVGRSADGSLWIGVPSAPDVDSDGRQRERDGKRSYSPCLSFGSAEAKQRWQRSVTTALADAGITP